MFDLRVVAALATGLTVVSGAADAFTYLVVGKVFSSAVTGNLALLGVAVGAAAGSYLVRGAADDDQPWPPQATAAFSAELVLLVVWRAVDGRPDPTGLWVVLLLSTAAMVVQSGTYRALHVKGVFGSTYLSGNFVVWMANLLAGRAGWPGAVSILGLVVGAAVEAWFVCRAPLLAGIFPAVVLAVVVAFVALPRSLARAGSSTETGR